MRAFRIVIAFLCTVRGIIAEVTGQLLCGRPAVTCVVMRALALPCIHVVQVSATYHTDQTRCVENISVCIAPIAVFTA